MLKLTEAFNSDDYYKVLWPLLFIAAFILLIGVGLRSPWPADEPRFVEVAREMVAGSPGELRWMDASNRGYMLLSLTPQVVTNEWIFMDNVKARSLKTKGSHKMSVQAGRNKLDAV